MKQAQPIISVLENDEDVMTFRMATGRVLKVGQAEALGECGGTPLGIRTYGCEAEMWLDLVNESMDEEMVIITKSEYENLSPYSGDTANPHDDMPTTLEMLESALETSQAANKKLIAQEKELNKKLIAGIEAIPDKEVKRTEKDKRIAALKNNPRRVPKPSDLNKLEKEIAEALKTPIDKAVNLFTRLYYDRISDNAKTAVTREEFKQSARAEITSITINEFKPETINRQGENIINDIEDIVFQRGGLRYVLSHHRFHQGAAGSLFSFS